MARPSPLTRREALLVAAGALIVTVLLYGDHWRDSGFVADDFSLRAKAEFGPSYLRALADGFDPSAARPGLNIYSLTVNELFGGRASLHLAAAAALAGLAAFLLHLTLRVAGVPRAPAAVAALLFLLFPYTDATRLWAQAGFIGVALVLALAGALAAVLAARAEGRRAVLLAALAGALWAASVGFYEAPAGIVVPGLALLAWRARERGARIVALVALAVFVVLGAVAFVKNGVGYSSALPHGERIELLLRGGADILGRAVLPTDAVAPWLGLLVLGVVVAVGVVARRRLPAGDERHRLLGTGLNLAGLGVAVAVLGYAAFEPVADPGPYAPVNPGLGNRVNVVSAIGDVLCVTGALTILAALAGGRGRRAAVAAVPLLALVVLYAVRNEEHERPFAEAVPIREAILFAIDDNVPLAPGTTVYVFGAPRWAAPGVPIFAFPWDLRGAVRLRRGDESVRAFPVPEGGTFRCEPGTVVPLGGNFDERDVARYGPRTVFFDVPTSRLQALTDRPACERAAAAFAPGPDFVAAR